MDRRRCARRGDGRRAERGAAAVEFALVGTLLVVLVFGILQYGLYFNDSLNAHQGVRETARMAVVGKNPSACRTTTGWSTIACTAETMLGTAPGDTYVNVSAPDGWSRGNSLRVCVLVRSRSDFGMLPLPNDGYVRASLRMSIEQDTTKPPGSGTADSAPSGQSWSWCD
ncbi:TadE/TadG family type IV pilus assembly protein [Nocardioides sp. LHD-245]|uniref:TadE/TadG family type IV pilus assembly protein n=1 Tax=Nocardioides sp. LHD-245 TaxID=3051387 RepID=UPI0027DED826|nr:TadE/TadG family type IV pilus assembly protein [Nocardioides sp. LHD-245]